MKYFAVVDTNVIVSAMLKSNSTPAAVLREVLTGNISLLANEEIFDEYTEVLSRKKIRIWCEYRYPVNEWIKKTSNLCG